MIGSGTNIVKKKQLRKCSSRKRHRGDVANSYFEELGEKPPIKKLTEVNGDAVEEAGLTHYNPVSKIPSGVIRASFSLRRSVDVALSLLEELH